jgi:hypothetical protein
MIRVAAGLLAIFAAATGAQAEEIGPMQAKSIALGNVTGVAYYTVAPDGFRVVATMAAGENGQPMRFVVTLVSGQKVVVSVPQAAGEAPMEMQIARLGDSVVVTDTAGLMN